MKDEEIIISTLREQGEAVDTHTISMITNVFTKRVHDEVAKKEFVSVREWDMKESLNYCLKILSSQDLNIKKTITKRWAKPFCFYYATHVMKPLRNTKLEVTSLTWSPLRLTTKRFIINGASTAYLHDGTSFT